LVGVVVMRRAGVSGEDSLNRTNIRKGRPQTTTYARVDDDDDDDEPNGATSDDDDDERARGSKREHSLSRTVATG